MASPEPAPEPAEGGKALEQFLANHKDFIDLLKDIYKGSKVDPRQRTRLQRALDPFPIARRHLETQVGQLE